MDTFLKKLRELPIVKNALAEDAAAIVARRVDLLRERAAIEADGASRHEWLRAERAAATARREKAGEEYAAALTAEMRASADADGANFATQRELDRIDEELRKTAGSAVEIVRETSRQLSILHNRLRISPIPVVTQTIERRTRDGDIRKENAAVADTEGRGRELRELIKVAAELVALPTQTADIDEILGVCAATRARFGIEEAIA